MDRHCHKGQNSHMKNGDVAPPVPEAPEVLNNTKQRRGYKIPREFQASQKVKDVPSSSYRVARNQLLFSMDVQSQAEGLYVVSLHLVNLSPFVRPRFKPSAPLEMCLMSTRSHTEIIKHCQAQYFQNMKVIEHESHDCHNRSPASALINNACCPRHFLLSICDGVLHVMCKLA